MHANENRILRANPFIKKTKYIYISLPLLQEVPWKLDYLELLPGA